MGHADELTTETFRMVTGVVTLPGSQRCLTFIHLDAERSSVAGQEENASPLLQFENYPAKRAVLISTKSYR